MIPLHQRVDSIETKLDEILSYVKPTTPVQEEINLQQQLDIALAQIEGLRQALVAQAQWLTQQVQQMQQIEPIMEVLEPMEE